MKFKLRYRKNGPLGEYRTVEEALAEIRSMPSRPKWELSIDDLVNLDPAEGVFDSTEIRNGKHVGVAVALEKAFKAVGDEGIVASLPYLVAGKAKADPEKNYLWKNYFVAFSEEDYGIDKKGRRFQAGTAIVAVVHGGGILQPKRIFQAYETGLTDKGAAIFSDEEFDNLLQGQLPDGGAIEIYTVDDVKKNKIPNPFGRYAVALPFETAKATKSGWFSKEEFLENPLVWARVGTLNYLEEYFAKAAHFNPSKRVVGNWYPFEHVNPDQPQGRLLFVDGRYNGLGGSNNLNNNGRSVRVKGPEALREA